MRGSRTGLIRNLQGKCLDASQRNTEGGKVHMWECDENNVNQQWTYDDATGVIRNVDGLCLDSPARSQNAGLVHVWTCYGEFPNQQWMFDQATGQIKIRDGICLDSPEANIDGGLVHMWACDTSLAAQQWSLGTADDGTPFDSTPRSGLIQARLGICLDAPGRLEDGGQVHMWECDASNPNQDWSFDPSTGLIRSVGGKCLDAPGRLDNGGQVHMWTCIPGNPNQEWTYTDATGQIRNQHGICLDASERSTNGGVVHMWECSTSNTNQQWQLGQAATTATTTATTATTATTTAATGSCSTPVQGDACHTEVTWAMGTGIHQNPGWYPGLTAASSFEEFQALLHATNHMGGVCPAPCTTATTTSTTTAAPATTAPGTCRTVTEGECYDAVLWAMSTGINEHPEWYPGLDASSGFRAFQQELHNQGHAGCPAPCSDGGEVITPQCAAVWSTLAVDNWSSGTCGERITYLQGQGQSFADASAETALYFLECEPCWPVEKYKASGDTRRSAKRGIAIESSRLMTQAAASLTRVVSWAYSWSRYPQTGGPDLSEWDRVGVHWVPMIWDEQGLSVLQAGDIPSGRTALLGFNEPNFPEQANLSPQEAAAQWVHVERLAAERGIQTLVSPAMNFHETTDPLVWLRQFFAACQNCRVDAVALHSYTCYGRHLREHINLYKEFGRPLWLTEFACSDQFGMERLSAAGQMEYMREAIPLLERDPDVAMYAWFSYFENEWDYPILNGKNGDAGLIRPDGTLSDLGLLYESFASSVPVETPDVSAAVTITTAENCKTALAGEPCYDAVTWAMQSGIYEHPEWYPGLTASSTFAEFQSFLHSDPDNQECTIPPCTATVSRSSSELCHTTAEGCPNVGVNIFGSDGFDSDASLRSAIHSLFQNGVRHFRLINVWAWQDNVLNAINEAAAAFEAQSHVSVHLTSMFFDSSATCLQLSKERDFSLMKTAEKLAALTNIGRFLVQLDTCSICPYSSLHCLNPTEQGFGQDTSWTDAATAEAIRAFILDGGTDGYGPAHIVAAHRTFAANVEFVIPYQSSTASPSDLVSHVSQAYVAQARAEGRKVHLEGTLYPFWDSAQTAVTPFPATSAESLAEEASRLGFDGFVVSETGWPMACTSSAPHAPASEENMCGYFQSVLQQAETLAGNLVANGVGDFLVYLWKLGPADAGACGERSFGLFDASGAFVCSGRVPGWKAV